MSPSTEKEIHLIALPENAFEVQVIACVFGFDLAFAALQRWPGLYRKASTQHLHSLAIAGAQGYLQDNTRTNDEQAFIALFIEIVPRAYRAMVALLDSSPGFVVALKTFAYGSIPYRVELHRGAMHNMQCMIAAPAQDAPLTITWPPLEAKEVA